MLAIFITATRAWFAWEKAVRHTVAAMGDVLVYPPQPEWAANRVERQTPHGKRGSSRAGEFQGPILSVDGPVRSRVIGARDNFPTFAIQ